MKLVTENYTVESDHHGFSLTVKVPSEHEKSKTGFTEKRTFHADLHQVSKKMISYELSEADYSDVQMIAYAVDTAADRLSAFLVSKQNSVKETQTC